MVSDRQSVLLIYGAYRTMDTARDNSPYEDSVINIDISAHVA
jgi:hypothetical protein